MDQRILHVEMRIPEVRMDANFSRALDIVYQLIDRLKDFGYEPTTLLNGFERVETAVSTSLLPPQMELPLRTLNEERADAYKRSIRIGQGAL